MKNQTSSALAGPQSDVKRSRQNSEHFLIFSHGYEILKPPAMYVCSVGKARQDFWVVQGKREEAISLASGPTAQPPLNLNKK